MGYSHITGLCNGHNSSNKLCLTHIRGYKFELFILITDPLAQWREENAHVTVNVHDNTIEDGTLLSTGIRGEMNNPLSSLADLLHNTSIALLEVFLTTPHHIVIVSFMKMEEFEKGWRSG